MSRRPSCVSGSPPAYHGEIDLTRGRQRRPLEGAPNALLRMLHNVLQLLNYAGRDVHARLMRCHRSVEDRQEHFALQMRDWTGAIDVLGENHFARTRIAAFVR